ncbi:flavin reductase family protein [Croceicoccus sp. F390]|uniref:Flavin reductase family protein n=1 Tax=Croceicoccus esteveae TaxID=3075597 RepID=A0ABU2ZKI6_9SPHN|nr:flavin reductase family protein [Croceicoccus sp. F390]MDT0576089.1 flavin reductase family protein [Croceicoccus sp. F390]
MGEAIMDSRGFRDALGSFATGVTVITTVDQAGGDVGLTASSFNSVSLDPPMVLWSLARTSRNMDAFSNAEHFAVHILAAAQQDLSNRFAKRGEDKFAGLDLERGSSGIPLIKDCAARFECRTRHQYDGGDHVIFVGEVIGFARQASAPLIFHGGNYALAARIAAELSQSGDATSNTDYSLSENFLGYLLGRAHFQLYGKIGEVLARHALGETDHFILSVMGMKDARTTAELGELIAFTGMQAGEETMESLARRGFVLAQDNRWLLSDTGRNALADISAAAVAAEAAATAQMSHQDITAFKNQLKHLIHATDPGVPDGWA